MKTTGNLRKLYTRRQIDNAIKKMAETISRDFPGEELVIVCVLKGSFMFTSDLLREIKNPDVLVDFIRVSSYGRSVTSCGKVTVIKDLETDIAGKNVIIAEDILDSGLTLTYVRDLLAGRQPRSLRIAALVDKRARRRVALEADYVGFTMENGFIVGYGIDYAEKYRNLPEIYVVEQDSLLEKDGGNILS
jgi:hypoxanthine phosphoribosyltransferase